MIIDYIEIPNLYEGSELAFLHFESRFREALVEAQRTDRRTETDNDGVYVGNYLPEGASIS